MKSVLFVSLMISCTSLVAQNFWLGKSFQVWRGADRSMGFNETSYWENTYKIYSPIMLTGRLEFEKGIYVESSLGIRNERLKRRAEIPFDIINFPHNVFTSSSHIRTSYLLDFGSGIGYKYRIAKHLLSADIGPYFSKLYFLKMKNIENPFESQQIKHKTWIDQEDFMLDLQLGLGLSYLIKDNLVFRFRILGRRRIHTTKHLDLIGRGQNMHPSHKQEYLFGSALSIAYNFWD